MAFIVPVELELIPPQAFMSIAEARERLSRYGWRKVVIDSGPVGKLSAPETRRVVFTLEGKTGADKDTAIRDVQDALIGTGGGTRFVRGLWDKANTVVEEGFGAAGRAAGTAANEFGSGLGIGGGLGLSILGILALAVVVFVGVVAVKRG